MENITLPNISMYVCGVVTEVTKYCIFPSKGIKVSYLFMLASLGMRSVLQEHAVPHRVHIKYNHTSCQTCITRIIAGLLEILTLFNIK